MRVSELSDLEPMIVPSVALDAGDAGDSGPKWMQVAEVGTFFNPRYGDISIDKADIASMFANFKNGVHPRKPVELPADYEHLSTAPNRKPGDGIAAGWFKDLELRADGMQLWALIDWTKAARQKIVDGEYRYLSPTFHPKWGSEGKNGATLLGGAMTNYPTLPGCVLTCSLVSDLRALAAHAKPSVVPSPKDQPMKIKLKNGAGEDVEIDASSLGALTLDVLAEIPAVKELQEKAKLPEGHKLVKATDLDSLTTQVTTLSTTVESQKTTIDTLKTANDAANARQLEIELDGLLREGRMFPHERDEMKELAQLNRTLFDKWVAKRKANAPVITLNQTFGTGGQGDRSGSAVEMFDAEVERLKAANPKLTFAEAIKQAAEAQPALARQRNLELSIPVQDGMIIGAAH